MGCGLSKYDSDAYMPGTEAYTKRVNEEMFKRMAIGSPQEQNVYMAHTRLYMG